MTAAGIYRGLGVKEVEFRQRRCQSESGVIERADRSDVFPIIVEDMCLHIAAVDRRRYHLPAKIDPGSIDRKQIKQMLVVENVNTHRREEWALLCFVRA